MESMPRKRRTTDEDVLSACDCVTSEDHDDSGHGAGRRVRCELCGELFVPRSDDEVGSSLCPECRRTAVRICPYCERPYRTDRWPHDLCPDCYEEQEWRCDSADDEYEDEFDSLDAY